MSVWTERSGSRRNSLPTGARSSKSIEPVTKRPCRSTLRFLHVETLGRTFLNVIGVRECGPQRLFDAQAGQQGLRAGAIEQIVRGEIRRLRCDEIDRPLPVADLHPTALRRVLRART